MPRTFDERGHVGSPHAPLLDVTPPRAQPSHRLSDSPLHPHRPLSPPAPLVLFVRSYTPRAAPSSRIVTRAQAQALTCAPSLRVLERPARERDARGGRA